MKRAVLIAVGILSLVYFVMSTPDVDRKDGVDITKATTFDGQSGIGSIAGEPVVPQNPYPWDTNWNDSVLIYDFASDTDPTPDTSRVGNNTGDIGAGAAEPTWVAADGGVSDYFEFDGTDSITSTVTEAKHMYALWADTNTIWWHFVWADETKYINGYTAHAASYPFTLSRFVNTSATEQIWGNGFSGSMDRYTIYSASNEPTALFWNTATNHGWSQYDYDNRAIWTNMMTVYTFSYDASYLPSTAYNITTTGTKPGGAANPTHETDTINGWYDFDQTDYLNVAGGVNLNGKTELHFSCWFKVESWVQYAGILISNSLNEKMGLTLASTGSETAYAYVESGGSTHGVTVPGVTAGVWHHISVSWNSSWGEFRAMLDGGDVVTKSAGGANANQTDVFKVGFDDYQSARKFNGDIDEIRISAKSLTTAQQTNLYNETKFLFGL